MKSECVGGGGRPASVCKNLDLYSKDEQKLRGGFSREITLYGLCFVTMSLWLLVENRL